MLERVNQGMTDAQADREASSAKRRAIIRNCFTACTAKIALVFRTVFAAHRKALRTILAISYAQLFLPTVPVTINLF